MATKATPKPEAKKKVGAAGPPSRNVIIVYTVVKVLAILGGGIGTFVALLSIVGALTENGWVRAIVALVVSIGLPLLVADRLLPKDDSAKVPGLVSDVFAVIWLLFAVVFTGVFGNATRGMLTREGDRLQRAGWGTLAQVSWFLAGVKPDGAAVAVTGPGGEPAADAGAPDGGDAGVAMAPAPDSGPGAASDAAPPPNPGRGEKTPAELFKELAPSVVAIQAKSGAAEGGGTGFLIDGEGTIVTNHHVIGAAKQVRIKFINGARFENVELLEDDETNDLALLRIDLGKPAEESVAAPSEAKPLTLGDSDAIKVGERAISIGNPLGLEHTLTDGLISARRIYQGKAWIQMSVPVSPGNSGGPVFNMKGEVIGVTAAQITGGFFGNAQNLNLAIPVNVLKNLIKPAYPKRKKFGDDNAPSTW